MEAVGEQVARELVKRMALLDEFEPMGLTAYWVRLKDQGRDDDARRIERIEGRLSEPLGV